MPTPNLNLEHIAVSQSQKEVVHNDNMDIIDSKLAGITGANDGQLLGIDGGNTIGIELGDGLSIVADTLEVRDASITDSGFINTIAQAFMGIKTFLEGIVIGATSGIDLIDGEDTYKTTIKANAENAEDVLFILPPDWGTPDYSLCTDGDGNLFWASRLEAAITSLGGLTGATQTLAIGTSGTNITWSSSGTVHTLNIPDASSSARGVITTGSQTILGSKTFSSITNIGTATSASNQLIIGNSVGLFSSAAGRFVIRPSSPNIGTLRVMGNGGGSIAASFEFLCDDDTVNFGRMLIAGGTNLVIAADRAGSGTARPLRFRAGNADWTSLGDILVLETNAAKFSTAISSTNAIQIGASDTIVYKDGTSNLRTNSSIVADKRVTSGIVTLTDGATPALDASLGNTFTLTAAGDRTIAVPSNPVSGQTITIQHTASGGDRTLALNTGTGGFVYSSAVAALTITLSGKTDLIVCKYIASTNKWMVCGYTKEL